MELLSRQDGQSKAASSRQKPKWHSPLPVGGLGEKRGGRGGVKLCGVGKGEEAVERDFSRPDRFHEIGWTWLLRRTKWKEDGEMSAIGRSMAIS
jgi:hypothetical protein